MAYTVAKSQLVDYQPEALEAFHLVAFEWIDNLHFISPPEHFIAEPTDYVAVVKRRFRKAGWAGDGSIGLLWLPPFVFPLEMNIPPVGVLVWHVKQENDGISWLLSPIELPFEEFSGE